MSTPTFYAPTGSPIAGNTTVAVADAIADIDAPTAAECNDSVFIECAVETFGVTTNVSWISRKKLCDVVATQRPGNRTYNMEAMNLVLSDPQGATQAAADLFVDDAIVYVVQRLGKTHDDPFTAGDKVVVYQCVVGAVDLAPTTTDEGAEAQATVQLGVVAKSEGLFVEVAA